jgi:hypothetical protein
MSAPESESAELSRAEAGWNRVFYGYAPYLGLGLLLAAVIPDQGLTWPALQALVDMVAHTVPSIDRLAVLSPLPQMTRAFGALMWLALPVFTVLACLRSPRVPRRIMPWSTLLLTMPAAALVVALVGVAAPFFFIADAREPDYLGGRGSAGLAFLIKSRIGHGTLGSVIFAFSSVSLVFLWRVALDYPRVLAYNFKSRFGGSQTK